MERISQPRSENITIRITETEKREFKKLARINRASESNWGYHILKKHKHSYGKIEDIDQLLKGLEMAIESLEFNNNLLEEQILKMDKSITKYWDLLSLKLKIVTEIINLKNVKKEIEEKRN